MLSQSIASLFALADNFALEFMAVLALIWFLTLGYVIVRKVSGLVKRLRSPRVIADPYAALSEVVAER